jgi:hypothetical protein
MYSLLAVAVVVVETVDPAAVAEKFGEERPYLFQAAAQSASQWGQAEMVALGSREARREKTELDRR